MENENTNLQEAIDLMDELLEDSFGMPLTKGKSLIDYSKFRELLDTVKVCLPHEIEEAKQIVSQREEILSSAKNQADEIMSLAMQKASEMIERENVVKSANERAIAIVSEAKEKQKELLQTVQDFFNEVLGNSENTLKKSLNEIEAIKESMKRG